MNWIRFLHFPITFTINFSSALPSYTHTHTSNSNPLFPLFIPKNGITFTLLSPSIHPSFLLSSIASLHTYEIHATHISTPSPLPFHGLFQTRSLHPIPPLATCNMAKSIPANPTVLSLPSNGTFTLQCSAVQKALRAICIQTPTATVPVGSTSERWRQKSSGIRKLFHSVPTCQIMQEEPGNALTYLLLCAFSIYISPHL